MRRPRRLLMLLLMALPILACQAAMRLVRVSQPTPTADASLSLAPTAATEQAACATEMGRILRAANSESQPINGFLSTESDLALVTYKVSGDQLSDPILEAVPKNLVKYQKDFGSQESAWNLFTKLIPEEQRSMLGQFRIMTDGPGGILSAVEQTNDDASRWVLELDIADAPDTKNLAFTLLHEFGHLLTLGPQQVPPDLQIFNHPHSARVRDRALAACPNYFPGEGCSLPASYLNVFFGRFWSSLYGEWDSIDRMDDTGQRDAKLDAFYRKYRTQFVDSYAVTSPVEDIAETWAYYILSPRPTAASVMDQKVGFFYAYPELVSLRTTILSNLCAAAP